MVILYSKNMHINSSCTRHLFKERNDEIRAYVDNEPVDALVPNGHEVGPDVLLREFQEVGIHSRRLQPLHQEWHVEAPCKEDKLRFLFILPYMQEVA